MTTEAVLILSAFVLILFGTLIKSGPRQVFVESSPKLGARIERQLETGSGFTEKSLDQGLTDPVSWRKR